MSEDFAAIVERIPEIGRAKHAEALIRHAEANRPKIQRTLRDLPAPTGTKAASGLVISAGPSIHRRDSIRRIKESGYTGSIIAVDAAYVACLKRGLVPDYVVTLDPHLTRMVRWFGDHDFERHAAEDDYFKRQDLNVEFRNDAIQQNLANIELINRYGPQTRAIVASSAPANVVARLEEAGNPIYWWNPLVDDPRGENSLTRRLFEINRLPSMNTGGNVGSAAWVFAHSILKVGRIGLVGMDLGYYHDTPLTMTQGYYELAVHLGTEAGIERCFRDFVYPQTGERFYTDPTYFWYRKNLLQLLERSTVPTFNCTEGGTLFGEHVTCLSLDDFLAS